jgi:hypothetical protein
MQSVHMYHLCNTQNANFSWLNSVKTILDECGFSYYGLLLEIYIELRNLFRLKYQNIVQK